MDMALLLIFWRFMCPNLRHLEMILVPQVQETLILVQEVNTRYLWRLETGSGQEGWVMGQEGWSKGIQAGIQTQVVEHK